MIGCSAPRRETEFLRGLLLFVPPGGGGGGGLVYAVVIVLLCMRQFNFSSCC